MGSRFDSRPPTLKQQRYLRLLAQRTGTTYTPPRTRDEASTTIEELKSRRHSPHGEIQRDRSTVARDMATRRGDAAQVTSRELNGYGASATWAGMPTIGPKVVHCKREEYDVYVGRLPVPDGAPPGSDGFWGNPWKAGRDGTRAQVIERYEQYVLSQPRMLARLPQAARQNTRLLVRTEILSRGCAAAPGKRTRATGTRPDPGRGGARRTDSMEGLGLG